MQTDARPFIVKNDDAMRSLDKSINENGAVFARPRAVCGYELLCGTDRKRHIVIVFLQNTIYSIALSVCFLYIQFLRVLFHFRHEAHQYRRNLRTCRFAKRIQRAVIVAANYADAHSPRHRLRRVIADIRRI